MRTFTEKGRVVYNRPRHTFSERDVDRIVKRADLVYFEILEDMTDEFWGIMDEMLVELVEKLVGTLYGMKLPARIQAKAIESGALEAVPAGIHFIMEDKYWKRL